MRNAMRGTRWVIASAAAVLFLVVSMGLSSGTRAAIETSSAGLPTLVQEGYGTIKGRLVWGGAEVPKPAVLKVEKDTEVCGKQPLMDRALSIDPKTKGIAYAFAYLVSPKGKNADAEKALLAASPTVTIDNVNCEFQPYSTAAHKSQGFVFKSSDPVGHNAHYTGFTNNKNNAIAPKGKIEDKLVFEKRPIKLQCDIHPWMKGWIMIFDHPFYAVTAADGSFEVAGVPAGEQNLVVWQEKVGYVNKDAAKGMKVSVPSGGVVDVGEIVVDPAKVK